MKKIAFIIHGKYKSNKEFKTQLDAVFQKDFEPLYYYTETAFHSVSLTEEAIQSGAPYIICCGGDGSLNECANGIMNQSKQNKVLENITLGVLPMGTGNDFIKTISSPSNANDLKELIIRDQFKQIDLGLARFQDRDQKPLSRYFINITDIGIGGVVAEKLSRSSKMLGSYLTYQMSIVSSLMKYKKQPITVTADSFSYSGEVMNFIVANGKWFGSGLGIAPDADPADGQFDIVILGGLGLKEYIRHQSNVRKCEKIIHDEIKYFRAKKIAIRSEQKLPIDMDGEFVGYSPLEIEVIPCAIRFLA